MTKKTTKPSSTQPLSTLSEPSIAASEPSTEGGTTVEFLKSLEPSLSEQPASPKPGKVAKKTPNRAFGPGRTKTGLLKSTKAFGQTTDPTFAWVRTVCQRPGVPPNSMEVWRSLAERYLAHLNTSSVSDYAAVLWSVRLFLEHYAWEHEIYNPQALLTTPEGQVLPKLQGPKGEAPYRESGNGTTHVNCLIKFLEWAIKEDYSVDGEGGATRPMPFHHVPWEREGYGKFGYRPAHTLKESMPFKWVWELREMLAPGEHFRDWNWAQEADGVLGGNKSGAWFEVEESAIDKTDPDCVWRQRDDVKIFNCKLPEPRLDLSPYTVVGKKTVFQMWSPVAAVALLAKLYMPWRTFQTRMLDSGETDFWSIEINPEAERQFLEARREANAEQSPGLESESKSQARPVAPQRHPLFLWKENLGRKKLLERLPIGQRGRVGEEQGVFLKCDGRDGVHVGFFVNTNKTADRDKTWHHRGYRILHQHEELHRWLVKLRNWQRKYNPVTVPTLWTELAKQHLGQEKSHANLEAAAPTCFLFRDASARGKVFTTKSISNERKPITDKAMNTVWCKLLRDLEDQKAARNETHEGQPIKFLKVRRASIGNSAPFFGLHSLRVSLITILAKGGMEIALIMELAGHTRLDMTIYYWKISALALTEALRKANEAAVKSADADVVAYLKNSAYEQIAKHVVVNANALREAVPYNPRDRNPAGWQKEHGGWCLMGGATVPTSAGDRAGGGCYNGGSLLRDNKDRRTRVYAAVRPKQCIECNCRWFVTRPEYAGEIMSITDLLFREYFAQRQKITDADAEARRLFNVRYRAETAKPPVLFTLTQQNELERAQRLAEQLNTDSNETLRGIKNCLALAARLREVVNSDSPPPGEVLVALGTSDDLRTAIEPVSELLAESRIALNAEIYPNLAPRSESAILRRSQIFDELLAATGKTISMGKMTVNEQNKWGNHYMRKIAGAYDANMEQVVKLIEGEHGEQVLLTAVQEAHAQALTAGGHAAPTTLQALLKS